MALNTVKSWQTLLVVVATMLFSRSAAAITVADGEFLLEVGGVVSEAAQVGNVSSQSKKANRSRFKLIKKSAKRSVREVSAAVLDEQCRRLIAQTGAKSCSPNYQIKISATPNDPNIGALSGLNKINAKTAWDFSRGSSEVVVAVIDTGVDYTHPDLENNMWRNSGEIAGNHIDDDSNGYVDDVYGYDFVNEDSDPFDDHSHGTHVAGTIGAQGNNAIGVVGVNWDVQIMALKFLDGSGSGYLSDAIRAVEYATANGAKITNNSWGGGGFSRALYNAINSAKMAGVLFVAAAGNEANDNDASPSYPASYDLSNVISVAATDNNDNLAYFSNYGATSVHIAAPGVRIVSTVPGASYSSFSGTSMATPHVAGAAALLLSANPSLTALQLKDLLLNNGDTVASLSGSVVTASRLNIAKAILAGIENNLEEKIDISVYGKLSRTKKTKDILYGGKVAELTLTSDSSEVRLVTIALEISGATCSIPDVVVAPGANIFSGKLPALSTAKGDYSIRAVDSGKLVAEAFGKIISTRGKVASKATSPAQIQRQCNAALLALTKR